MSSKAWVIYGCGEVRLRSLSIVRGVVHGPNEALLLVEEGANVGHLRVERRVVELLRDGLRGASHLFEPRG